MKDFTNIKSLYNILIPNGFSNQEIEDIKAIFGYLPQVLVDYYQELGNYDFNQNQDSLILPKDFKYNIHPDYLIIYVENQGVCFWGIHKDDLKLDNPPIYISYDKKEWQLEAPTTSAFLEAMAYLQATFYFEYYPETFFDLESEDLNFIENNFKSKEVYLKQWTTGIKFYSNEDDYIIIVMSGGTQMLYSANNLPKYEFIDKILSKLGTPL